MIGTRPVRPVPGAGRGVLLGVRGGPLSASGWQRWQRWRRWSWRRWSWRHWRWRRWRWRRWSWLRRRRAGAGMGAGGGGGYLTAAWRATSTRQCTRQNTCATTRAQHGGEAECESTERGVEPHVWVAVWEGRGGADGTNVLHICTTCMSARAPRGDANATTGPPQWEWSVVQLNACAVRGA